MSRPGRRPRKFDAIAAVEACYRAEPDDRRWLAGVLEEFAPLDRGPGLCAYGYDASDPAAFRILAAAERGAIPAGWERNLEWIHGPENAAIIREIYASARPYYVFWRDVRHLEGARAEQLRQFYARMGASDAAAVFGADALGRGAIVVLPSGGRSALPPRTVSQLERVAAHLASAHRLRRAAAGAPPAPDDALTEALVRPSGRVEHAAGAEAKRSAPQIAAAVRRIEQARGRGRLLDPDAALGAWRGLVDGTWSVVDHVESDGRRLLLARRNPPGVRDPVALSPRERDVLAFAAMGRSNKYIGYMLGLSPASVAGHLRSAQRKLGVASRRELIQLASGAAPAGRGAPRRPPERDGSRRP